MRLISKEVVEQLRTQCAEAISSFDQPADVELTIGYCDEMMKRYDPDYDKPTSVYKAGRGPVLAAYQMDWLSARVGSEDCSWNAEKAAQLFQNFETSVFFPYDADGEKKWEDMTPSKLKILYWTLVPISFAFYNVIPEFFFPVFGGIYAKRLRHFAEKYDITLPERPDSRDSAAKCMYYVGMCAAFTEFRKLNGLTPAEFCALVYAYEG